MPLSLKLTAQLNQIPGKTVLVQKIEVRIETHYLNLLIKEAEKVNEYS
jgi:hypothetical protein